jgi:2'-5' RNA ligase
VEGLQAVEIGQFQATEFYLYSSEPGPRASVYRKLQAYQFEQP